MPFIKNIDRDVKVYKKKGWVKIKNFLKKKELSLIRSNIENFIKQKYKKYSGRDINFANNSENSHLSLYQMQVYSIQRFSSDYSIDYGSYN